MPSSLIYDPRKIYENYINIEYPKDILYDGTVKTSLFKQDNITKDNTESRQVIIPTGKTKWEFTPDKATL